VLVAGRSAIATITQSVLVAVVYVPVIVPDVVAILKLAPPKKDVVALFHKVVWLDVASEEVKPPPPPSRRFRCLISGLVDVRSSTISVRSLLGSEIQNQSKNNGACSSGHQLDAGEVPAHEVSRLR
jgi:hypothetical protein